MHLSSASTNQGKIAYIFSSFAQEDSRLLAMLEKHLNFLQRQGLISHWNQRTISPGSNWQKAINDQLSRSDIILLLLSADFLASDSCTVEMAQALAQYEAGKAVVLPILLRPSLWHLLPSLAKLQVLPRSERDGAKPVTRWGNRDEAFVKVMEDLCDVVDAVIARPATSSSAPITVSLQEKKPSFWNLPYPRNPYFTSYDHILTHLHNQFTAGPSTTPVLQTLPGSSGIGKTQLALEYAYRHKRDYQAVFWLQADSREQLVTNFLSLADLLALPENNGAQDIAIAAIKRWFAENPRWLLIFDNAEDLTLLQKFIPDTGNGAILITTRNQSAATAFASITIDKMPPDDGVLFLLRRSRILADNVPLQKASKTNRTRAQQISELLDGHPLALEQAGAYREQTKITLAQYLRLYRERHSLLLQQRATSANDHPISIATTFLLSFQRITDVNPLAANLLRLCAFLYPDSIPEKILIQYLPELRSILYPTTSDTAELDTAIQDLLKFSLIQHNSETHTLTLPQLLQQALKDEMPEAEQRQWAEQAVRAVDSVFPDADFELWEKCQRYLPHALICKEQIAQWQFTFPEAAHLLNKTGAYLYERAQYPAAQSLHEQALAIYESIGESELAATALTLNYLGELARKHSDYALSEAFYTRALAIRERILGPDHPDTAQTLNSLGVLAHTQDHYALAQTFYERAFAIRQRMLEPGDPDLIGSLGNLAGIYDEQGEYIQAEQRYEEARALCESALMPQHPKRIQTLSNLARFYRVREKYAQSEALFLQVLPIARQTLGAFHPEVATLLNNLAFLYWRLKKYSQAEQLLMQAIEIWVKVSGETHINTSASRYNLARIYVEQDNYAAAEPLFQQALNGYVHTFGSGGSRTRAVLEDYNALLRKLGKPEIALS